MEWWQEGCIRVGDSTSEDSDQRECVVEHSACRQSHSIPFTITSTSIEASVECIGAWRIITKATNSNTDAITQTCAIKSTQINDWVLRFINHQWLYPHYQFIHHIINHLQQVCLDTNLLVTQHGIISIHLTLLMYSNSCDFLSQCN